MDENALDMTERIIHATAEITGMTVDRLWENWHTLERYHGFDYTKTLIDFLASSFCGR